MIRRRHTPAEPLRTPENAPQPPSERYPRSLLGPAERADLADSLHRHQACQDAITNEFNEPPIDTQQLADEAEAGYDLHTIRRREVSAWRLTSVDGVSRA